MELTKGPRRIFKQQQQAKLYSHTLNLNTIALQISQKMLFGAGKSNRIENNENESTYQYRTLWKHAFSTHIIKKGAVLPRSIPVLPIHEKNKMSYLHLHSIISCTTIWQQQGTLLFPWNNIWFSFLIILCFLEVWQEKRSNTYTITVLLIILTIP